jgi:hypothetical protein
VVPGRRGDNGLAAPSLITDDFVLTADSSRFD